MEALKYTLSQHPELQQVEEDTLPRLVHQQYDCFLGPQKHLVVSLCVAVCCSVCCSVLQYMMQCVAVRCNVSQCVARHWCTLQQAKATALD